MLLYAPISFGQVSNFADIPKSLLENIGTLGVDDSMLYVFNEEQKKKSGGYDAAIVYWCKFVLPVDKVVERLKKSL